MTPRIDGLVADGFGTLADRFAAAFAGRSTMGAALSVRVEGRLVVDLWGGVADERTARPWLNNTPSVIFSGTKGIVSILAARLVQEGRLDYDAPVTAYWPEFGTAGKGEILVRHALSHQAGLSAPDVNLTTEDVLNWNRMVRVLERQKPLWTPGKGYAYHALTHGWLVGELIRRVTGRSVGDYLQDLICRPLKADLWIGLPPAVAERLSHLHVGHGIAEFWQTQAAMRPPEAVDWPERAMTLGGALPLELVSPDGGFNDPTFLSAEIPGAGGVATASALASVWSATVTATEGVRLLDDDIIEVATKVQTEGAPIFPSPGPYARWGMGFLLDSPARRLLTPASFGHDGAGGQVAFADPLHRVGFGFVTNLLEGPQDERATAIVDALRALL